MHHYSELVVLFPSIPFRRSRPILAIWRTTAQKANGLNTLRRVEWHTGSGCDVGHRRRVHVLDLGIVRANSVGIMLADRPLLQKITRFELLLHRRQVGFGQVLVHDQFLV